MRKLGCAVIVAVLISGCATNKQLVPTGGSRADGNVVLSFQYGAFEKPVVDFYQGVDTARQRCSAWGYSDAEPFGGKTEQCINFSGYGCNRWQVNVMYQCIGDLEN